jgi:hypothetical protein
MAYTITKTDGTTLTTISDGTINNVESSSLVLIGKNYAGYGAFLNDNFVRLLENFAYSSSPANPIRGQLWWDTTNNILKVYSGTSWKISTGATSSPASTPPGDLSSIGGDLWWDTTNNQLKVYSGSSWVVVGPVATPSTGDTGAVPALMTDVSSTQRIVIQFRVSGVVYAIFAKEPFTTSVTGFTTIKAGLNFSTSASPSLALNTQDTAATNNTLVQRDGSAGIAVSTIAATTVTATGAITAPTITSTFTGNLAGNVVGVTMTATNLQASGRIDTPAIYGTIQTASQTNITTVGNLTVANVSGALNVTGIANLNGTTYYKGVEIATVGGSASFTSINDTVVGNVTPRAGTFTALTANTLTINPSTVSGILPTVTGVVDIGSTSLRFGNIWGTAIKAQYADLAERFEADAYYPAGTVVEMGGNKEITKVEAELSDKVFGVISTNAAYLMNSAAGNDYTHPPIAMSGRVPVRVIGMIAKGDRLVSAGNGIARAGNKTEITAFNVIGRSLVDKLDSGEGIIEAIVKINS